MDFGKITGKKRKKDPVNSLPEAKVRKL